MHLQKRLRNILFGAGLAIALVALPASWALSPNGQMGAGLSAAASKMGPLDINSASIEQLKGLPGIGETYAKRIIAGRPYSSKSQLVTKGILPRNVYSKVQSLIIASHMKK